jgi:hypothetical protein
MILAKVCFDGAIVVKSGEQYYSTSAYYNDSFLTISGKYYSITVWKTLGGPTGCPALMPTSIAPDDTKSSSDDMSFLQ